MRTIIQNAVFLPEEGIPTNATCAVITNGRIEALLATPPATLPQDEVIDAEGMLLIPAFYNAHCHAAMTLFRGYGEDLPLDRWLNERIWPAEERLNEKNTYVASQLAIAEMLRAGVVSFTDMYMFEEATARAVLESGIKANLSRCIVSFDPTADPSKDYRIAEAMALAREFHNRGDGRLKIDLSLHAEYTNVPSVCAYTAELAAENGLLMQLHLSETEKEHNECIARHGKTPTRFFDDLGVFRVPTSAAHAVWVNEEDIAILAERGVSAVHNPVSNLKLGSGVMPLSKMLRAGVNVALGTDGVASNNRLDILRELQTAAILHKGIERDPAVTTARSMLPMATENGARAQGRNDCGRIAVGKRADLLLIDRNALHNQPVFDDYAMLCYSAERSDVRMTMVDGRILYRDGAYTSIDEERLRYESREVFAHYFE